MKHHSIDLVAMQKRCRALAWSVDDIDWDADGRDAVSPEQAHRMRDFLADLVWIEHIGARGFVAMSKQARRHDPVLGELLATFADEEERHAEAERRLMVRWGLLPKNAMPEPSPATRCAACFLDAHADDLPLSLYVSTLTMFEIGLDGALLKFLTEGIGDPLAHEVFELINRDEARHLATDFHLLEEFGGRAAQATLRDVMITATKPMLLEGTIFTFVPVLEHMLGSAYAMGIEPHALAGSLRRFGTLGRENARIRRHAGYQLLRPLVGMIANPRHPYHRFAGACLRLTNAREALTPSLVPAALAAI